MDVLIRKKDWLLPVALISFLLTMVLIPFAAQRTFAGRNDVPNHVLTYTTGSLTWDSATSVDKESGVAELSLFNSTYQNVQAGLYIVVMDDYEDGYTHPEIPQTGDSINLALYVTLLLISGMLFLLFVLERRKEKQCKKF